MFSLIITIISIALVAVLALATIYYGGAAFNRGGADAAAARLITEGQQINGAYALARSDVAATPGATLPTTMATLVSGTYLSSAITGWTTAAPTSSTAAVASAEICQRINVRANGSATVLADAAAVTGVFGCHTEGSGWTMLYKN